MLEELIEQLDKERQKCLDSGLASKKLDNLADKVQTEKEQLELFDEALYGQ